jgi:3'-5' exoribonuclease
VTPPNPARPGAGERPRPRDWVGAGPLPCPPLEDARDGDFIVGCFYLAGVSLLRTRQDKPYLRLQLTHRSATVDGRIWDDAEAMSGRLQPGIFVGVKGRVQVYNGLRQLKVEEHAPLLVAGEDLGLFIPCSARDAEVMAAELETLVRSLRDRPLRSLLRRLLLGDSPTAEAFRISPAAKRNHHACIGGLLEHSLSVAQLCDLLARHYGKDAIDRDLLVAAALIHDIGKLRELSAEAGFPYTDDGKLLGHILLGLETIRDAAREVKDLPAERLRLLLHLVAAHQGRYEWQSPREPQILEGLVLHYADDLDAKMNQAAALLANVQAGWSAYDRSFAREFFRHRPRSATDPGAPDPAADTGADPGADPDSTAPILDLFQD